MDIRPAGEAFFHLRTKILSNKSFYGLVHHIFERTGKEMTLEKVLNAFGRQGLRNRLAASFIHYEQEGYFPKYYNPELIEGLLRFEKKLDPYSFEGHSRGLLLGFFLEISSLRQGKSVSIPEGTWKFLRFSRSRVFSIDWILLLLSFLRPHVGDEALERSLQNGLPLGQIIDILEDKKKDELFSNLLNYASSIGEYEIFCDKIIT